MKTNLLLASILSFGILFSCKKEISAEDFYKQKDSLEYFKQAYKAANYFSIEDNENARAKFSEINVEQAMDKIRFDLAQQSNDPTGFLKIDRPADQRIFINKAAVLNNRWIILDYYVKAQDGTHTEVGEMLLQYYFHADKPTEFHILSTNVY